MFKQLIGSMLCLLFCSSCEAKTVSGKHYGSLPLLFYLDNYDDCMLLGKKALFCSVTYQLYPLSNSSLWMRLKEISANPYNYRHDILRHGICVPKTCPNVKTTQNSIRLYKDVTECYNDIFLPLDLHGNITKISCDGIKTKHPIDWIDMLFGIFIIIYMSLIAFASFYEMKMAENQSNGNDRRNLWRRILFAFSIRRNWIRLKTINTDPDTKRLRCIQGVRFYSMMLVILVHTIMTLFLTLPVSNTRFTETLTNRLSTMFLTSGPLCIATFFLISSWLLIYGIFGKFQNNEISVKVLLHIFINRYIRLTPSLALTIAFQATWLRHLGDGPNWNAVVGEEYLRCRKNWWTNMFYLNNFIDPENMCMQTTWHLALDTQYFVIMLLLIWFIKKTPKSIRIVLGTLLTLSICVSFLENYVNNFPALIPPTPESLYGMNHTLKNKQWRTQYIGFFGNIAGPIIGLCFGYVYLKYKEQNTFTRSCHIWMWHILVHGCWLGTILIAGLLSLPEHVKQNIVWASVYVSVSRPIFAIGLGLLLFGMSQGVGGLLKRMFEWHPLYVLGRLTYSVYLVHVPLLLIRGGMIRSPVYINEYSIFFELVGHLTVSYMVATIFTLFFEMPFSELQKIVFQRSNAAFTYSKKK